MVASIEELVERLDVATDAGWVNSARPGNDGGVGNTLENLLGIEENNFPIPDLGIFELKSRSLNSVSNVTLFHMEPFPRSEYFVPRVLLPQFGWDHQLAGMEHPIGEQSFRLTLRGATWTNRGFRSKVDSSSGSLGLQFDASRVDPKLGDWLASVRRRRGTLDDMAPRPIWPLDRLYAKSEPKLRNTVFTEAESRTSAGGQRQFRYVQFDVLFGFNFDSFVAGLESGAVVTEFDADLDTITGRSSGQDPTTLPTSTPIRFA